MSGSNHSYNKQPTWGETLLRGNVSNGIDPLLSNGDVLRSVNGNSFLNLREDNTDSIARLHGEEVLYLTTGINKNVVIGEKVLATTNTNANTVNYAGNLVLRHNYFDKAVGAVGTNVIKDFVITQVRHTTDNVNFTGKAEIGYNGNKHITLYENGNTNLSNKVSINGSDSPLATLDIKANAGDNMLQVGNGSLNHHFNINNLGNAHFRGEVGINWYANHTPVSGMNLVVGGRVYTTLSLNINNTTPYSFAGLFMGANNVILAGKTEIRDQVSLNRTLIRTRTGDLTIRSNVSNTYYDLAKFKTNNSTGNVANNHNRLEVHGRQDSLQVAFPISNCGIELHAGYFDGVKQVKEFQLQHMIIDETIGKSKIEMKLGTNVIVELNDNGTLSLPNIPTSSVGLSSGQWYDNSGVLTKVP